jgi:DNA polymerase-4
MMRNDSLVGRPAAVAGDPKRRAGIILAANYEARARGVKTAMVLHQALKLCPEMVLVPPDHCFYGQKSEEVMDLLSNYTPVVEQNSIDEAWLDMTGCEGLYGPPVEAAGRIMYEIEDKLGLWCSIGIAENKFLAKMASEMKKPRGITELWKQDIQAKFWPLPVREMYGVGAKTAARLNHLGIQTIGDLARFDINLIAKVFGKDGNEMYLRANGIDNSPVLAHGADDMQSIGRSTTLPEDIAGIEKAKLVLMALADDVGMTVRRHGKKGRTVHITLKYSDFKVITRQMTVPATCTTKEIYRAGCTLLEQNWNRSRPVRLLGISLSGFDEDSVSGQQLSLFDQLPDNKKKDKNEKIDRAMDAIRNKYGSDMITFAALVKK